MEQTKKVKSITLNQLAAIWGISLDRLHDQYWDNAKGLRKMQSRAIVTGKKVNGYTADELDEMATRYESMSTADGNFLIRSLGK